MATINTLFKLTDNVTSPLKLIQRGFGDLSQKVFAVNQALQLFNSVSGMIGGVTARIEDMTAAYNYQSEQETKLTTIMRQRMNASRADIQAIKDLASAQQGLGIYGDEVILQGAQELASFTSNRKAIETLIPAMNNLIAQQYGYSASGAQFQSTADMMGKVLSGQTGALSRMGYIFSEEEKKMLQFGTEEQKAAALAKIITDNVGRMNETLAKSPRGQIQQLNNMMGDLKETTGGILLPLQQELTIFKSKMMVNFYGTFNTVLQKIVPYLRSLIRAFTEIYERISTYTKSMGNLFEKYLGKAINWVIDNLHSIAAAIVTLSAIMVAKSLVMAAAWVVANWPIVLGIALIAGFVAAVIKLSDNTEEAGKTIGRVFGAIYAVGYQAFALLWNVVYDFVNFLGNAFDDPISAIDNLFYQLIADIVGWFKWLPGEAGEWARKAGENISKWSNEAFGGKFSLEDHGISKMEVKSYDDIMHDIQVGGEIGGNLGAKIDSGTDIIQKALRNGIVSSDITEAIESALSFTGNGALSVSDKDSIDITKDYRDLLSAKATEKFGIRLNSMTPQVSVQNLNINNGDSAESAVAQLINATAESAYAQGLV